MEINNLVFEGGGILGISYLGALDYLYQNDKLQSVKRTAGTSSGALTACITGLNLPFKDIKNIADSLEYGKVPYREDFGRFDFIPEETRNSMQPLFGDVNCLYRLITGYGWFSTEYIYEWLKQVIANQFNEKSSLLILLRIFITQPCIRITGRLWIYILSVQI